MTDLEMTKLCAEAMGLEVRLEGQNWNMRPNTMGWQLSYDPLHNDAQAMALLLHIFYGIDLRRVIVEFVAKMAWRSRARRGTKGRGQTTRCSAPASAVSRSTSTRARRKSAPRLHPEKLQLKKKVAAK